MKKTEAGEKRKARSHSPEGSGPAWRPQIVGDGEGQDHKEGQPVLWLLDGILAGRRQGAERASGELPADGWGERSAEGPEVEDVGIGENDRMG